MQMTIKILMNCVAIAHFVSIMITLKVVLVLNMAILTSRAVVRAVGRKGIDI